MGSPFPELPPWWMPKAWFARHEGGDLIPPPSGYATWDAYYNLVTKGEGMTLFVSPGAVVRGRKVTLQFTRVGEDVATMGLHLVHASGTDLVDFSDADCLATETRLLTLWGSLKTKFPSDLALDRFIWHDFGVGIRRPNPMVRDVAAGAIAGTTEPGVQLPPQVAISVTLKTTRRRTWGRVFLPAADLGLCSNGRIAETACQDIRTAWGTFLDDSASHELPIVIWSPRRDGGPLKYGKDNHAAMLDDPDTSSFALTVDQVQVDDLFDVIESRRFDKPLFRETHTIGA